MASLAIVLSLLSTPLALAFQVSSQCNSQANRNTALFAQRTATFGMGCFWAPSEDLLKVDGVVDTVVGYTGNPAATEAPSYDNVCFGRQWVEGVRVTYDDSKLPYDQLLDAFFETQNPKPGSRQYESIIFYANDEEKAAATSWMNKKLTRSDGLSNAVTDLEASSSFYMAEGYHQRYWQKMRPRIGLAVALISVSSGILDSIIPEQYQSVVHSSCNVAYILGAVALLAERKINTKVVELS